MHSPLALTEHVSLNLARFFLPDPVEAVTFLEVVDLAKFFLLDPVEAATFREVGGSTLTN